MQYMEEYIKIQRTILKNRVSCILGWPPTPDVTEDDFELLGLLPISSVLGLSLCATTPNFMQWSGFGNQTQSFVQGN